MCEIVIVFFVVNGLTYPGYIGKQAIMSDSRIYQNTVQHILHTFNHFSKNKVFLNVPSNVYPNVYLSNHPNHLLPRSHPPLSHQHFKMSIRILCFGDSLTSGWFCQGLDSHPYSLKLEDRLTGAFPDVDFQVVTDGCPGDVASFERFQNRIKDACMDA